MTNVLVVGHSDDDGHVIAEQARLNLSLVPSFNVSVVVDPKRTYGHRSWLSVGKMDEIAAADLVFFVDLMFSPATFIEEAAALTSCAASHPDKRFYVIDHHPLPLGRLYAAANVRAVYRPDVFECCVGLPSGLMIVAALCERQNETVGNLKNEFHTVVARGMKRAAAPGSVIPGEVLMKVIAGRRWDLIAAVGSEEPSYHRLVRGRRSPNQELSPALKALRSAAKEPMESFVNAVNQQWRGAGERDIMPYDLSAERFILRRDEKPRYVNEPSPARDLEALVTILEVAALNLTESPDSTFTREQLLEEARSIGGEGIFIDERDARIVLEKAAFITWSAGEMRLR